MLKFKLNTFSYIELAIFCRFLILFARKSIIRGGHSELRMATMNGYFKPGIPLKIQRIACQISCIYQNVLSYFTYLPSNMQISI